MTSVEWQGRRRWRTVLVEDSRTAAEALSAVLHQTGKFVVVHSAQTEYAATEWLLRHTADWEFAIVDLLLRAGHGFNVLTRFAKVPHVGEVIVYSALVSPAIRARCFALGADQVFGKADADSFVRHLNSIGFPARE